MKDVRRLAAGAQLGNGADGTLHVTFVDFDGGVFDLAPKMTENSLIFVDPQRPAGYGFSINATDPAILKRVANALNSLARSMEGDDSSSEE